MKLLRRHSTKNAEHVELLFFVERLSPWPTLHGSLAVQWQRGTKRTGQTKPAWPDSEEPSSFATYIFGETLVVPATLYKNSTGGFQDKEIKMFIAQVDDRGKELNVLGGFDLNLADFANVQGRVRQEYPVECSSAIWGAAGMAGGRPLLTLTVGVARGSTADRTADLAAAMSDLATADDVPSTLSTNDDLGTEDDVASRPSSRYDAYDPSGRTSGLGIVREEDARLDKDEAGSVAGPTPPGLWNNSSHNGANNTGDTPPLTTGNNSDKQGGGISGVLSSTRSPVYDSDGFLIESDIASASRDESDTGATSAVVKRNLAIEMDEANGRGKGGVAGQGQQGQLDISPQPDRPTHARRFSRDGAVLGSRKWAWRRSSNDPTSEEGGGSEGGDTQQYEAHLEGAGGEYKAPGAVGAVGVEGLRSAPRASFFSAVSRGEHPTSSIGPPGSTPDVPTLGISSNSASAEGRLARELQITAALESAVYLAGNGWAGSSVRPPKMEALQAPARRLARTIIILGQDEGTSFGLKALTAIKTASAASLGDVHRLLLWWANVVTLRWSLWALGRGKSSGTSGDNHFGWMEQSVVPALRHLEESLFEDLVEQLWTSVLLRAAKESAAGSGGGGGSLLHTLSNGSAKGGGAGAIATTPGSPEVAIGDVGGEGGPVAHWVRALHAVDKALSCGGRPLPAPRAVLALARRQALLRILLRLDNALFANLLADGGTRGVQDALDPALLPFQRGSLTFSAGVELKIAAGRLANWAADAGVREGTSSTPSRSSPGPDAGEGGRLFEKLRAAADLLMMPKGSLSDSEVRATVAPSLSVGAICQVLQRYQPDDPVVESFTPTLLKQLRKEEAAENKAAGGSGGGGGKNVASMAGGAPSSTTTEIVYEPPSEDALLEDGVIQPLSLEMSADSDDELSALEDNNGSDSRFHLLRDLWSGLRA